jgi:hypothetical protein
MSPTDDFEDVIAAEIPDDLIEELLRGAFEPELPTELVLVGRVLRAAHGPIPGEDRAREVEVVEAMLAAMCVTPIDAARPASHRLQRRRALGAVTAAVSVLGIGGVAAAAGGLPAPIQSFVSDSLSHVGVSVPSTEDEPSSPDPGATDSIVVFALDRSENAPGQGGNTPGQSGNTPGQSGNTPGQSGSEPPGQSGNTPGQSGNTPGQSGNTPGQSGSEPPGHSGVAPGQSGDTSGQSENKPDDAEKKPDESDKKSDQSGK